jgi:short-subunit dehydrogenase
LEANVTHTSFKNKVVIITGASSGIGQALAMQLAGEGAWLALAARNAERLEAVAAACRQRGGKAIPLPTDVADEARCQALIQQSHEAYGRLDMLVNNAGMAVVSKLEDLPNLQLFQQVMDVNFRGAVACTYHALPQLKQSQGRIVNVASLGGLLAIPYNTSYVASKFAMVGFSDALRLELAPAGVSVTVICPYWVVSEFHEHYLNKDGQPKGPAGRALYTEKMMTADQCATAIIAAARRRQRQVIMRPGLPALWLKLISPALLDRLLVARVMGPIARRLQDATDQQG